MPDADDDGEKLRAMLVYTRRNGWAIVEPIKYPKGHTAYWVRKAPTRNVINPSEILGTAELPPVPESAA